MPISNEMIEAARSLGQALGAEPAVQAFKQVEAAIAADGELSASLAEIDQRYHALIESQQAGHMLSQAEIHGFYQLRDRTDAHPLLVEREQRRRALKTLFEQVSDVMNSILTVDYSRLVLKD